jgi:hypothetical protein
MEKMFKNLLLLDIILKVDHLRTIHAMFALNWLTGFRAKQI